jgi:hypothetical protein
MSDYLDASYALESLSSAHPDCALKMEWEKNYFPHYVLTIKNYKKTLLANSILNLVWSFQYPEDITQETEYRNHREVINEYEVSLTDRSLRFPEVVEAYFANLINGAYYEFEYEVISEQIKYHPERLYGFWASAYHNASNQKVYVSADSWILPKDIALQSTFKEFEYEGECSLLNAELVITEGRALAISEGIALEISFEVLMRTLACAEEITKPKDEYAQKFTWAGGLFSQSRNDDSNQTPWLSADPRHERRGLACFVSEYSDFLVIETGNAKSVIFSVDSLKQHEILEVSQSVSALISSIIDEIQSPSDISIPWNELDDETFEQLCYDIIYHNSKYDRQTIRKMGKSKSRDGGRDIVVHTKAKLGEQAKKYIFQCKRYNPDSSANTSNVKSISDVIDQYGADGYGLMCSCYIDSSLYDRLDGIAKHRSILTETWSKFELERYIARRPTLKARFLS